MIQIDNGSKSMQMSLNMIKAVLQLQRNSNRKKNN